MPLIITLILLVVLWMYCANDKANLSKRRNDYEKDHPPCKLQEEYLLSCELYHKYLREGRKDAAGDAMYDARYKIYQDGYLPSSLELGGRSLFSKAGDNLRNKWLYSYSSPWMEPTDPPISIPNTAGYGNSPNSQGLAAWRDLDASPTELRSLKHAKYTDIGWREYCKKMDDIYERLVIESLISWGVININKSTKQPWINSDIARTIKKCPSLFSNIYMCREEYEDIIERHKEEIPVFIEKEKVRRQELFIKQQKESERRQQLANRPNGRGRSYDPDRY